MNVFIIYETFFQNVIEILATVYKNKTEMLGKKIETVSLNQRKNYFWSNGDRSCRSTMLVVTGKIKLVELIKV